MLCRRVFGRRRFCISVKGNTMFKIVVGCMSAAFLCLICDGANGQPQNTVSFTTPIEMSPGVPGVFGANISKGVTVQNVPGWSPVGTVGYDFAGAMIIPLPTGGMQYHIFMYSHTQQYVPGSGNYRYSVFQEVGGNPQFPNRNYLRTLYYTP